MTNDQTKFHTSVNITVYFPHPLTDDEVMKFVDELLHEHQDVQDYEYEHFD